MKKLIIIIFLLNAFLNVNAQRNIAYNTIRKHEISVSVLPIINILSGFYSGNSYVNFNFSYKYYFKNKFVLRTAFVLFPALNFLASEGDGIYIY